MMAQNGAQKLRSLLGGPEILVAPVVRGGAGQGKVAEQTVYFPPGDPFYHVTTGERFVGQLYAELKGGR